MGQSSSKRERRAATEVQRRTREGQRRDRPASFTFGESNAAPDMDPQRPTFRSVGEFHLNGPDWA